MGNGFGVIRVHVLDHADFSLTGERVGQRELIDPVNRTEATDVAVTDRGKYPEIEIMGIVVALRLREIAVVTLGGCFDGSFVFELLRFSQISQTTDRLYVFSAALTHEQRAFRVFLQIVGVLGDTADQDQRPALLVQTVRNHGAERETGY
ncbi:hypothetical protein D3C71_1033620 [compost metagenome]